jgi:GTPase SAR1 family protein
MERNPDAVFQYKKFELEMPPVESGGCSILMLASGRAGKTTALKYIIEKYFKKHCGAIFSESAKAPAYQHMKYPLLPLSSCFIPKIINTAYKINKETKNHYPFLFVLDDCPLVKNDKEILKLLSIYRNSAVSGIICVQSPTLLNNTVRSNFTIVMLGAQNSTEKIEQTIKAYLRGYFPDSWNYEKKIAWYRQQTADHHFLLINNWTCEVFRTKIDLND